MNGMQGNLLLAKVTREIVCFQIKIKILTNLRSIYKFEMTNFFFFFIKNFLNNINK